MKTTKAALKTQLAAVLAREKGAIEALGAINARSTVAAESADPATAVTLHEIAALAAKGLGR